MKNIYFPISISLLVLFFSCEKEPEIPTGQGNKIEMAVSTDYAIRIDTLGFASATIINIGYLKALKEHGHCWSTSPLPDTNSTRTKLGAATNITTFNSSLSGLGLNTTYYVRAYIANETHVAYGEEFIIKAVCGGQTEISHEGQSYKIVAIGNQCWMARNLNVGSFVQSTQTHYPHTNVGNNGFTEKYCYDNDEANCITYGGLYDWNEMMAYTSTEGAKGICPNGWHIPTNSEWETLVQYLGGSTHAGAKLKPFTPYQFDALMGGYRLSNGIFTEDNLGTRFWTSSLNNEGLAYYRYIVHDKDVIINKPYNKTGAFHVRCIKNEQ